MKKLTTLALLVSTLAACSHLATINTQSVSLPIDNTAKVKQAILQGCSDRGWFCKETSPSVIEGTLNYRNTYTVNVSIPYSDNGYEIIYKNSSNLKTAPNKIHKAYYRWTSFLNKSIQKAAAEQAWKE